MDAGEAAHAEMNDMGEPCGVAAGALIRIGLVTGAHGLQGALRIKLDNPDSEALRAGTRVFLEHDQKTRAFRVNDVRRINRNITKVTLEGVGTADAAEALRGAVVLAAATELPSIGAGEFYYHQVIGCEVVTVDGERIGTIDDVFSAGASDVWVVRENKREVLVPVIEDIVKRIDLEGRRMTIAPVPGLLEP